MQTYKDLQVWKEYIQLVMDIYNTTQSFTNEERFGLISQMRRCAVSIPSNIAEGFARAYSKENARFVGIAYASAAELETQLIICKKLEYADTNTSVLLEKQLDSLKAKLYKYRTYLLSVSFDAKPRTENSKQ